MKIKAGRYFDGKKVANILEKAGIKYEEVSYQHNWELAFRDPTDGQELVVLDSPTGRIKRGLYVCK